MARRPGERAEGAEFSERAEPSLRIAELPEGHALVGDLLWQAIGLVGLGSGHDAIQRLTQSQIGRVVRAYYEADMRLEFNRIVFGVICLCQIMHDDLSKSPDFSKRTSFNFQMGTDLILAALTERQHVGDRLNIQDFSAITDQVFDDISTEYILCYKSGMDDDFRVAVKRLFASFGLPTATAEAAIVAAEAAAPAQFNSKVPPSPRQKWGQFRLPNESPAPDEGPAPEPPHLPRAAKEAARPAPPHVFQNLPEGLARPLSTEPLPDGVLTPENVSTAYRIQNAIKRRKPAAELLDPADKYLAGRIIRAHEQRLKNG